MLKNKYNNKKTVINDIEFDSKKEAKRYTELKILERGGVITKLIMQPRFLLQDGFWDFRHKKHRAIEYWADFQYYDHEKRATIVEDVKGMKTDVYKLKKKLFLYKYPELVFVEI
jgi:hypothetical protein